MKADPMTRFMRRVAISVGGACWEWAGCLDESGYGRTYLHGRVMGAHRASWILHKGEIPGGLFVCHRCDNPVCVRPDHLFLGTPAENTRDMEIKGRKHNGDKVEPEKRCSVRAKTTGSPCRMASIVVVDGKRFCRRHAPTPFDEQIAETKQLLANATRELSQRLRSLYQQRHRHSLRF